MRENSLDAYVLMRLCISNAVYISGFFAAVLWYLCLPLGFDLVNLDRCVLDTECHAFVPRGKGDSAR